MALFMEVHSGEVLGTVQAAHQAAMEGPGTEAIRYLRYWADGARQVFCLVEAPSREAVSGICGGGPGTSAQHIVELPGFVA